MAKDEMTQTRCDIVLALANNRMRVTEAARQLHMDRTTLLYHMKLISSITGKNTMNFFDLYDLVQMVERMIRE